jgi:DNA-binding LytR/AlgR family response regulator
VEKMKSSIQKVPFLQLRKDFNSPEEAYPYIKTQPVDLIFLDLNHDDFNGIQLLESLENYPNVIVTSAFEDFAVKAYELNVQDYLLKPFTFHRFVKAVNRIYNKMFETDAVRPAGNAHIQRQKHYIFVRTQYKMQKVRLDDIHYVQGLSNYLIIKTTTETIYTLLRFPQIMNHLPEDRFLRIHRSYIIAVDKIEYIHKNKVKIDDHMIPLGESYKQLFYDYLEKHELI